MRIEQLPNILILVLNSESQKRKKEEEDQTPSIGLRHPSFSREDAGSKAMPLGFSGRVRHFRWLLSRVCRDKLIFVATNTCSDKTSLLSQQKYACCNKTFNRKSFVVASILLSRQKEGTQLEAIARSQWRPLTVYLFPTTRQVGEPAFWPSGKAFR